MKKFYSLIVLLLLCVSAAQAKYTYWGYGDKTISSVNGAATAGKAAIYIPAELAKFYVGKTVTGVRFGLAANVQSLSVFITTDLYGAPIATKEADVAVSGLNSAVKFDSPYTITGEGFYIGYEYKGTENALGCSNLANLSGNGNWTNFGDGWVNNGVKSNALNIYARIEGETLPVDLSLVDVKDIAVKENTPFKITGRLLNQSASNVSAYRIGYSIDGGTEEFADFEDEIKMRSEGFFEILHDGVSGKGNHTVKVRLVSVDGEPDVYDGNNSATVSLLGTTVSVVKRVLMEEFTGINCGWCPRGIVSIDQCIERYPDNFIAIAKHNYYQETPEALKSPTYDYDLTGTWPYCTVDRIFTFDPVPANSLTNVNAALELGTVVGLDAVATFVPENDNRVNVKATAQFTLADKEANYRFAFAVVEDGITGYRQNNAYAGGSNGEMGGFEDKGSSASVTLNHVARSGYGVKEGIENSIPQSVNEFNPIVYSTVLDLPSTVLNRDNIKVVAFIINKKKGTIENAVQVKVTEQGETAIADVNATQKPDIAVVGGAVLADGFDGKLSVYTIDGKQIANENLSRGVYVVCGTGAEKTFVKKIVVM